MPEDQQEKTLETDAMYKALLARITALEEENKNLKKALDTNSNEIDKVKGVVGGIIEAPVANNYTDNAKKIRDDDRRKELDKKWHTSLRR